MVEPEIKIRIRYIEYHQNEATVSSDLFQNGNDFVRIDIRRIVFMLDEVNDIRNHDDCHNGKSVIIEPVHKNNIS